MFRCDFDVMKNLESLEKLKGSEHSLAHSTAATYCTATTCTRLQKKRKGVTPLGDYIDRPTTASWLVHRSGELIGRQCKMPRSQHCFLYCYKQNCL